MYALGTLDAQPSLRNGLDDMPLFTPSQHAFAETVAELAHCNPFLPQRIALEQQALGADFDPHLADWNVRPQGEQDHANVSRLLARCEAVLDDSRDRLARRRGDFARELPTYEDLLLFVLYHRYRARFDQLIAARHARAGADRSARVFEAFRKDTLGYLCFSDNCLPLADQLPHLFAGFFQIRRAFANIFQFILGVSRPAVRLRAAVWESIFTHDMRRYRKMLYSRMADFTTLVTGPSGTGKELVAQAIGLSRYIPFDEASGRFAEDFAGSFHAVNLTALSPTLIESELFGHKRGSFTGAVADRQGWLEVCPALGTVFLDEIGDVDASIQVKLLRVLQSRVFSRLGETNVRHFRGKIIAASNRDLAEEMRMGRFRQDFYYRLCSDVIEAPTLHARIRDNSDELHQLVAHLTWRAAGAESQPLADEVTAWIDCNLGREYAWPGNIRELEQCVRNVLIRRFYTPAQPRAAQPAADFHDELLADIALERLTADELLRRYCTLVYASTKSYEATARKLKLDRRTVRAKVDAATIERLTTEQAAYSDKAN
jgi:DNA-binding NtrC family response regulator